MVIVDHNTEAVREMHGHGKEDDTERSSLPVRCLRHRHILHLNNFFGVPHLLIPEMTVLP
jgi:hypothetical protein